MIHINGHRGYIGSYLWQALEADTGYDLGWFDQSFDQPYDFGVEPHPSSDVIIHLAGYSSEPMSAHDPEGAWRSNVEKFRRTLECLGDHQLFIYASSASVYSPLPTAATEQDFVSSSRPYDCTKIICDTLAQMYINQGKNIVGLRLGTVAGLSPIQRIDTIVNAMTKSAIETNTINCVDPEIRRTILLLPDLANAIKLVINDPVPGIYNLGSIDSTVGNIAFEISRATDAELLIEHKHSNFYDFHLDCTKFYDAFGEWKDTSLNDVVSDLVTNLPSVDQGRRDVAPAEQLPLLWL